MERQHSGELRLAPHGQQSRSPRKSMKSRQPVSRAKRAQIRSLAQGVARSKWNTVTAHGNANPIPAGKLAGTMATPCGGER